MVVLRKIFAMKPMQLLVTCDGGSNGNDNKLSKVK